MGKVFIPTLYDRCNYLSMLGLKLNHFSKKGSCFLGWHAHHRTNGYAVHTAFIHSVHVLGPFQYKDCLSIDEIFIIDIKWSWNRLMFMVGIRRMVGIRITTWRHIYTEAAPCRCSLLFNTGLASCMYSGVHFVKYKDIKQSQCRCTKS